MTDRSPKLRRDRPFQVRHECWFGGTRLNGMVWKITMRVARGETRAQDWYVTSETRDGGPVHPPCTLAEALSNAREDRRAHKAEW